MADGADSLPSSSRSSTPAFHGFSTLGIPLSVSDSDSDTEPTYHTPAAAARKPVQQRVDGRRRAVSLQQRDARGRFVATRRATNPEADNSDTGSDQSSSSSLAWEDLDQTVARRWSVDTQHSVPAPDGDLAVDLRDLQVDQDGRISAASGELLDDSTGSDLDDTLTMADVNRHRDAVERALIQVEDDILPFKGRKLPADRLVLLATQAVEIKKILQESHLYLSAHDEAEYEANLRADVINSRRELSAFIVDIEEQRANCEQAAHDAERERAARDAGARADAERLAARRQLTKTRIDRFLDDVKLLQDEVKSFCSSGPANDEQLYERVEQHKVVSVRISTAIEHVDKLASQALDYDLIEESASLDSAVTSLRKMAADIDKFMLDTRKKTGVWAEKGRRAAARGDVKMPAFTGSTTDNLTVYEFEREWNIYKSALNYSVEEALKELKVAVGQPARAAIQKMTGEEAVFKYLKTHYGNPVILLNAKQDEIRGWTHCKGSDMEQREWAIMAKERLEALVSLCEEHKMLTRLHYSDVAKLVQSKFTAQMMEKFTDVLVDNSSVAGVIENEVVIGLLIEFLEKRIRRCTLGVNLNVSGVVPGDQQPHTDSTSNRYQPQRNKFDQRATQPKSSQHNQQQRGGGGGGATGGGGGGGHGGGGGYSGGSGGSSRKTQQVDPHKCVTCGGDHPALFYCEEFIRAKVDDRFDMIKRQQTCSRCLTMFRKFTSRKSDWWSSHDRYCKTWYACKEGTCSNKPKDKQIHFTVCASHATPNKTREPDFIKTLDASRLPNGINPGNLRFLHMLSQLPATTTVQVAAPLGARNARDEDGYEIIPDVMDPGLFLMQNLPAEADPTKQLLCFYDSGCAAAGLSNRAHRFMKTTVVREGPTVLEVAGAKSILIPYGEEQFHLELADGKQKATITGLRMANITAEFPLMELTRAWSDLCLAAAGGRQLNDLQVDKTVGGQPVDVIMGVKYLKYFPELVFSLPSGLGVYRAKLKSASGCQAVLGGPHAAWTEAAAQSQLMNPRVYLTAEARAWYTEQNWVRINQDKIKAIEADFETDNEETVVSTRIVEQGELSVGCAHCHCEESPAGDLPRFYNVAAEERKFWQVEQLGSESPYRCVSCRSCARCRKGDVLESISLREEAEQSLIENTIELDLDNSIVWGLLPFVEDPTQQLKPNRYVAERVFQAQQNLFKKNPSMVADTLKSHQKLADRGYVQLYSDLEKKYGDEMKKIPGDGYFIPWRTVYKEGSLSTPCRMVFDASAKTPGGDSLNGILAKGQNKLVRLQHLLMRLRLRPHAVTADITMAYNGIRLRPEHLQFQKYLWKQGLDPDAPTQVMVVTTMIYGVRSSGQHCQVALERLADYFLERGECVGGARALKEDTYVDDIISGQDTRDQCRQVASEVTAVLGKGSMAVKPCTFSGEHPNEAVSADGTNVGLAGYLWAPMEDVLRLDVGPPRLGRAKRGRQPTPVSGDFKAALSTCFTKRVLTGLVAAIFDPLGLTTPVTAGLKLDLHDLCSLQLDWDDPVPPEFLDRWAENMHKIQALQDIAFKRTVIPEDAVNSQVELLVASDASQHVGIIAVYGRVLRTCGEYSCQLLAARSKLLTGLTIPKAELKAAVAAATLGNVARANLGDRYAGTIHVTDSTVCLFWITQDDRPLQLGVRNAVNEIRRLSDVNDWYHVDTDLNVADLGTRHADVSDLASGSAWQCGQPWMRLPRAVMPTKNAAEVIMSAEDKRAAATELRANDVRGHTINLNQPLVTKRYALSQYLIDPCRFSWSKVVRVLALVKKFVSACRAAVRARRSVQEVTDDTGRMHVGAAGALDCGKPSEIKTSSSVVCLSGKEIQDAELYFFRLATKEVREFCRPKDYRGLSKELDGVLYYSGRLLDTTGVKALEKVMFDLSPVTFCRPLVDRHSPVAYSIMIETHWREVNHLNATTTYRESLGKAFILGGRALAQEIRDDCAYCRRYKARMVEVEMGKISDTRLAMAPPFTYCQVDLLGPLVAQCEHNHRSTVKVWGVVFKDPASGAVFVHAMSKCDTSAFIQAYTRFAARFCHPVKLYPDEGSQLLKACSDMEISWLDVSHTLNAKHQVGVEFSPCPVGGHNYHGQVERSIREVKKLFSTVYSNIKLDVLGYETAFSWVSNELNNLPMCLGSKYRDLDNLDLITPNRLIHGRSNRRAMSGPCTIEAPSKMLERMEDIYDAWWQAWHNERLADYVAKPPKWLRSDADLQPGDIVVFQKRAAEKVIGEPVWSVGRITEVVRSAADGKVREVNLEYRNEREQTWRSTHRAARSVAVLHSEGDLDVVQGLNQAARAAEAAYLYREIYVDQQEAVARDVGRCEHCVEPVLCQRHSYFFAAKPYIYPV